MNFFRKMPPVLRLGFGASSLVVSLVLIAIFLGLLPDDTKIKLQTRARISEALTVQLANAAARNDIKALRDTIETVQERDPEILSIAFRTVDGKILASTPDHNQFWKTTEDDQSTPTHVKVPLFNGDEPWGRLELAFLPIEKGFSIPGIPHSLINYLGFTFLFGFMGLYLLLKRTLRQLDPKQAVPSRVQNAFDSLSDGVVVIDQNERIVLVNKSLVTLVGYRPEDFVGAELSSLLWRFLEDDQSPSEFPWQTVLKEKRFVRDIPMNLRDISGDMRNLMVNASFIANDNHSISGAIVTFKDVSVLERKNRDLSLALDEIKNSEQEIKIQNKQLKFLANYDPLTNCMNRRSLFEVFGKKLETASKEGSSIACLMIDIDHFKNVNDTYGHSVGDEVIAGVAQILRSTCRDEDIVGRYGGEEFCMVLDGLTIDHAAVVAERIRKQVKQDSSYWIQQDRSLSVSIGASTNDFSDAAVADIIDQADKALYAAKESGRDRVVLWQSESELREVARKPQDEENGKVADENINSDSIDAQTNLPKLSEFAERLRNSIKRSIRTDKSIAVICVNLDTIEQIEDVHGHTKAGEYIKIVASRLASILRDTDTISLMSGKERIVSFAQTERKKFLVEVSDLDETNSVTWILQRLQQKLSAPIEIDAEKVPVRISLGASLFPHDGKSETEIIKNAILAQKNAQQSKGQYAFRLFSNDMCEAAEEQLRIETGIKEALEFNDFHIYFQPIIDIRLGKIVSAEVLLRCKSKKLKNTPIQSVIDVAEQSGLIHNISDFVFEKCFEYLNEWDHKGLNIPLVSVNVSADQLRDQSLSKKLIKLINSHKIKPSRLQIEITETAIIRDFSMTAKVLRDLQKLGVQVALDDFGTGNSSLSHILGFQPDAIKIDKSFINGICHNQSNVALVATVVELANRIDARVIAEGVETEEQVDRLLEIGCSDIQGYLLGSPMPPNIFEEWANLFGVKKFPPREQRDIERAVSI